MLDTSNIHLSDYGFKAVFHVVQWSGDVSFIVSLFHDSISGYIV